MKIKIVSDLHLEFSNKHMNLPNNGADVLVLSGDICIGKDIKKYYEFFFDCSQNYKHVVYVAGNHEFYDGYIDLVIPSIKDFLQTNDFKNVHMLENEHVYIDDVTFVGGTLWTDFNNNSEESKRKCQYAMNDYRIIRIDKTDALYKPTLTPDHTYGLHQITKNYIFKFVDELASQQPDTKVVVVGHMSPSHRSVAPEFRKDIHVNGAYASNLEAEIEARPNIKLWTHGHMHANSDYCIGDTKVVANPRGYYEYQENLGFDPDMLVEI